MATSIITTHAGSRITAVLHYTRTTIITIPGGSGFPVITSTTFLTPTAIPTSNDGTARGLSTGLIAGIVVAVLIGLVLIIVLFVLLLVRRRRAGRLPKIASEQPNSPERKGVVFLRGDRKDSALSVRKSESSV